MYEFLQDKLFLDQLDNLKVKEEFIKITVLSWQEEPIQEIQGKVINGSLNIDGNSSLRRTANLTVFAEEIKNDLTQIDDLLSINRKIKLEIGIVNTVPKYVNYIEHYEIDYKEIYGDVIWFPLGIFVVFDPNITHGTNGVNISLTLKDKMCLLNGDAGGVIPAAVEFHTREQEGLDGKVYVDNPTIKQIIVELVNHWGEEALPNIIISDVDERIKQVVQWSGNSPLYRVLLGTGYEYFVDYNTALKKAEENPKNIETYEYGQDVGFIITDFTYPGELIGDVGQTVTGVLDQIIQILGNYEYFYDVYGRFRFQEIKNYLNTTYTSYQLFDYATTSDEEKYQIDLSGGMPVYVFNNANLINSFSNAPLYSNVKNDYVVWGVRTDTFGNQIPIRYHLAIDKKPELVDINLGTEENPNITRDYYGQHFNIQLYTDEFGVVRARSNIMTFDSYLDFPVYGYSDRVYYSINGNTYYEWDENAKPDKDGKKYKKTTKIDSGESILTKDWREELYYQGLESVITATHFPYYFTELIEEWPKIYDLKEQKIKEEVYKDPSSIDFYLDIIDSGSDVGKYSVPNIGRRSSVVSEDGINCVFEQEVPDIVFIDNSNESTEMNRLRDECEEMGQQAVQVPPEIYSLLIIGGWQNSAYQRVCEMLYQYTNMNNSVTISSLPIYYLEPNTRITINDPASGIFGDYMIQSISIPLDISSLMNITASKALQKI